MAGHFKAPLSKCIVVVALISAVFCGLPRRANTKAAGNEHSSSVAGQRIFASNCASCHGLDGTGTQRAPNIVSNSDVQRLTQKELFQIVSGGVPGSGMPSFRSLGKDGVDAVAGYLRRLQGQHSLGHLTGDSQHGEMIFFGDGGCSNCHMADGRGGFIASDLTTYGQARSPEQIRMAIVDPAQQETSRGSIKAITTSGQRYEGTVRNEDNFSLQLQSIDGIFHSFSKSDLKSIERLPSTMPSDYSSRLSAVEVNDLVSYLQALAQAAPQRTPRRRRPD